MQSLAALMKKSLGVGFYDSYTDYGSAMFAFTVDSANVDTWSEGCARDGLSGGTRSMLALI